MHFLNWQRGFRFISKLISVIAILSEFAIAGGNDRSPERRFLSYPRVPLALQTYNLRLTPKGTIRLLTAFELRPDWQASITHARGDLYRFGVLRFDFGLSDHVSIQIRGAIRQVLRFAKKTSPVGSKAAQDVGDFSIATVGRVVPAGRYRPALGFRIETKLPNTNQDHGIGTNTTDIVISVLATQNYGPVLIFVDTGIGIFTAPRQPDDQNDVLIYGVGLLWKMSNRIQIASEVNGFVSPRRQIPLGTEDRSSARLGLMWAFPKFAFEALVVKGLNDREGTLGVIVGLSWQVNLFKRQ